jgi:amino acid transporter
MCGCSQCIDASRVIFAFSRDDALPGSRWWKRVNRYTQTPVNAVWFVMLLSSICGVLSFSAAAFDSLGSCVHPLVCNIVSANACLAFSTSVIGLYISYVTPIYYRITSGKDKFKPGPFHLGRWSRLIGTTAVVWVAFMVVMLLFPFTQPANSRTMSEPNFFLAPLAYQAKPMGRLFRGDCHDCFHLRVWHLGVLCPALVYWPCAQHRCQWWIPII